MSATFERLVPIPGTFNLRDLGGYPFPGGRTGWRRVLRADGLHRVDAEGVLALKRLGVVTVIDLRHADELKTHPNPLSRDAQIGYHHIPLFDRLAPSLMSSDDVLKDLYIHAMGSRGDAIASVLSTIAEAPDGAVLFHCTAGKDRTGLIAALLLAVVGVEQALIVEDYALTKEHIAPAIEGFLADAARRGMDIEHFRPLLACEAATMVATLAHLSSSHGSIDTYLAAIGVTRSVVDRLRQRLSEIA